MHVAICVYVYIYSLYAELCVCEGAVGLEVHVGECLEVGGHGGFWSLIRG